MSMKGLMAVGILTDTRALSLRARQLAWCCCYVVQAWSDMLLL